MQVRTRPILLVIIFGALILAIELVATLSPREPTYKGRTAEQWDSHHEDPEWSDAFLILGTNNLRLFVDRIDYDPKKDKMISLYSRLPSWLQRQRWFNDFVGRKNRRTFHAMGVLYRLGPQATPELPHLLQIVKTGQPMAAMNAIEVLGHMGETACPALIALTTHRREGLAIKAVTGLAPYTSSLTVRQALTNALHDPRTAVHDTAEAALTGRVFE